MNDAIEEALFTLWRKKNRQSTHVFTEKKGARCRDERRKRTTSPTISLDKMEVSYLMGHFARYRGNGHTGQNCDT